MGSRVYICNTHIGTFLFRNGFVGVYCRHVHTCVLSTFHRFVRMQSSTMCTLYFPFETPLIFSCDVRGYLNQIFFMLNITKIKRITPIIHPPNANNPFANGVKSHAS